MFVIKAAPINPAECTVHRRFPKLPESSALTKLWLMRAQTLAGRVHKIVRNVEGCPNLSGRYLHSELF